MCQLWHGLVLTCREKEVADSHPRGCTHLHHTLGHACSDIDLSSLEPRETIHANEKSRDNLCSCEPSKLSLEWMGARAIPNGGSGRWSENDALARWQKKFSRLFFSLEFPFLPGSNQSIKELLCGANFSLKIRMIKRPSPVPTPIIVA